MRKLDREPHDMDNCPLCDLIAAYARGRRARALKAVKASKPTVIKTPKATGSPPVSAA